MKKITKNDFYIIVFFPILFIIGNVLFSKCEDDYYKKLIHINTKDSIKSTLISSAFNNRGTMIINRKYAISTHDIENIKYYDFEDKIVNEKLPYSIYKKPNDDTISFKNEKELIFLIIKRDKNDTIKQIGDMSIWEFIQLIKKKM